MNHIEANNRIKPRADDGVFEYTLHQDKRDKDWHFVGHYTGRWYKNHEWCCLNIIDEEISYLTGMSIPEYQQYLIDNFNAYLKPGYGGKFTYFKTREEAQKALDKIISLQVMRQLV
jgi:hypothetical protein